MNTQHKTKRPFQPRPRCPSKMNGVRVPSPPSKETRKIQSDLFDVLQKIIIPPNQFRNNVRRNKHDQLRSQMFGKVFTWGPSKDPLSNCIQRYETSRMSQAYPIIHKILFQVGYLLTGKKFTTVCVNDSYQMARHRDANNVGESFILGLGDYTGGQLRIFNDDEYRDYDIRLGVFFNGAELEHEVLKFCGRRYSLVYFNC